MNSRTQRSWRRDELYRAAADYFAALVAHDPSPLAWASSVAFSENNACLRVPDELWNTISGRRPGSDLKFGDLAQGQVGWFGIVEEHGHPARMGLRLAVDEAGAIAE